LKEYLISLPAYLAKFVAERGFMERLNMANQEIINKIQKIRLNALSAVYLHEKRIAYYHRLNVLVEFLTIVVPVLYVAPRFLFKGTFVEQWVEIIWEILGVLLLGLAIAKVVFRWQDREMKHTVMARRNEDITNDADQLLGQQRIGNHIFEQFISRVTDIDAEDRDLFLDASQKEDQAAYRYALKHLSPGSTMLCEVCGANPWNYKPGDCAICGGTPDKNKSDFNVKLAKEFNHATN
jgi:mobilome CxxCx(11)CxxC protein